MLIKQGIKTRWWITGLTFIEISHVVLHKIRLVYLDYYHKAVFYWESQKFIIVIIANAL